MSGARKSRDRPFSWVNMSDARKSRDRRAGGAQERTRTFTAVKPLAPEASASTNSTTWAQNGLLRTGYAIVKLADCRPNPLYSIDTMAYRESAKSLRERSKFDPQELTLWHRI